MEATETWRPSVGGSFARLARQRNQSIVLCFAPDVLLTSQTSPTSDVSSDSSTSDNLSRPLGIASPRRKLEYAVLVHPRHVRVEPRPRGVEVDVL